MNDFFEELKRRNVFRVGVAYAAVAWVLMQVSSLVVSSFGLPEAVMPVVILFLALGFPLAILFAWAFELTPDGLKRSSEVDLEASVTKQTGQRLNQVIIGVLAVLVVVLLAERFVFSERAGGEQQMAEEQLPLGERSYDSIAVLPFVNMSDDPDQEYFSDGISEELLNLLAKTRGLRVAARTSSFAYKGQNQDIKGIGEQLDVQTVLEGSVRKSKSKVRITAQLIDVDSGYHLWSETYDRELEDIFAIQDEISAAIVNALKVHFGGEFAVAAKSTEVNLDAYQKYLLGRDLVAQRQKEGLEKAVDYFTEAIEIDGSYAPAYAGKAIAYMLLSDSTGSYGDLPLSVTQELARPLIQNAIELGRDLPDGYMAKGFMLYQAQKHEEALVELDKALSLQPSNAQVLMWKGLAYSNLQRTREALEVLESAHKVDPHSLVVSHNLINWLIAYGRLDEAEVVAQQMKDVAPTRVDRWARGLRMVALAQGDFSKVWQITESVRQGHPELDDSEWDYVLYRLGEVDRALENMTASQRINVFVNEGRCEEAHGLFEKFTQADLKAPGNLGAGIGLAFICDKNYELSLERANKLTELVGFEEDIWVMGDPSQMGAPYIYDIYLQLGRVDDAARIKGMIDQRIEKLDAEARLWTGELARGRVLIAEGDLDGAVPYIESAIESFVFTRQDLKDPFFTRLKDHKDYERLRSMVLDHMNKERADLGWAPFETHELDAP